MAKPKFYSVPEFKSLNNISSMEVLSRTVEGKRTCFVTTNVGTSYKAQANIDLSKPLVFLHDEGESMDQACLANADSSKMATAIGTL